MNPPKVYLSSSEGKFRVIQGGVPISADKSTAEEALAVAAHFRLKVSPIVWDGDFGNWRMPAGYCVDCGTQQNYEAHDWCPGP